MGEDAQTMRFIQKENVRLKADNGSLQAYLARFQQSIKSLTDLQDRLDTIGPETNV